MDIKKDVIFIITFFLPVTGAFNASIAQEKPNILVIVADDLGYSELSFLPYASEDVGIPNIDSFAERGVFFTNAYLTSPICSLSRVGLLTERDP